MTFQKELLTSFAARQEHIAIEHNGMVVRYGELLNNANRITSFLLSKNVNKETYVGISCTDRLDFIYAMIGIINAGCVFVPLDPSLPTARLMQIHDALKLDCVIASGMGETAVIPHIQQYDVSSIFQQINSGEGVVYPTFSEDNSIYVYFTSGSTGKPKGIIGKNGSLIHFLNWQIKTFSIDHSCRVSQFISPYFDAFLRDAFVPILTGGILCIPPPEVDFFTPEKMTRWVNDTGITMIHCVPSLFYTMNNVENLSMTHFSRLNHIFLSGENIVPAGLKSWYRVFGDRIQLVNFYGTTEATMISCWYNIQPQDSVKNRIPIGFPIDDTEILILDKNLNRCKELIPGDLYIVSEYMTKGYLNDPRSTEEKFVKVNLGADILKASFKTGDKARRLTGGAIELIGREDRQIKLRGIRVELDEIESILSSEIHIRQAVVVNYNGETSAQSKISHDADLLAAFIVREQTTPKDVDPVAALRTQLRNCLPNHIVLSVIIEVDSLPLLSNGKIDYKKLLELLREADNNTDIVTPKNDIEEKLLRIWHDILGDKLISTADNFHKIGGSSLSIMRLIARIYTVFGVRITLQQVFDALTIKKQAEYISVAVKDNIYSIRPVLSQNEYFLSLSQERIYYNYERDKVGMAYNMPLAWRIKGAVDKGRIVEALTLLVERHQSLRTSFKFKDGHYMQVISGEVVANLEEIEIVGNDIDQAIQSFIRPFSLHNGPLFRVGLLSTQDGENFLLFDIHHIVCDGTSQMILFSDFLNLYGHAALKPLLLQYKDYAAWENQFRKSEYYFSQREFWLKQFDGGIPKLNLPIVLDERVARNQNGDHFDFVIPKTTLKPVTRFLKENDITLFSGMFSLFYLFMAQITAQDDLVIGINTSGRMQEELDGVTGMFVKTLPIRYQLDLDLNFKDFTNGLHEYLTQAISRQLYDLSDIVSELNGKGTLRTKSLLEVMFVFQDYEQYYRANKASEFVFYEFANHVSKYPLTLFVSEEEDIISLRFEYEFAYFAKSDIELLAAKFETLVSNIAKNLSVSIVECLDNSCAI